MSCLEVLLPTPRSVVTPGAAVEWFLAVVSVGPLAAGALGRPVRSLHHSCRRPVAPGAAVQWFLLHASKKLVRLGATCNYCNGWPATAAPDIWGTAALSATAAPVYWGTAAMTNEELEPKSRVIRAVR